MCLAATAIVLRLRIFAAVGTNHVSERVSTASFSPFFFPFQKREQNTIKTIRIRACTSTRNEMNGFEYLNDFKNRTKSQRSRFELSEMCS